MPTLTVLYTRPEQDADAFAQEYRDDHVPIAARFPRMSSHRSTVFSGTPRGGEPAFQVMFQGVWDSDEDMQEAMRDESVMEASRHAQQMTQKYGNSAHMLIGD